MTPEETARPLPQQPSAELLADAVYLYSADEHITRAVEVLSSLERYDRPDLAVEYAKAHLLLAKLKLGME